MSTAERDQITTILARWRERLGNISWFIRCLNQPIAVNIEDGCAGHFWESRFCSQALLSRQALLSCLACVDLNPIPAKMGATPETSYYTSIQERISPTFNLADVISCQTFNNTNNIIGKPMLHFDGNICNVVQTGILFSLSEYLQLMNRSGRIVREDKRGAIASSTPAIMTRLNFSTAQWLIDSQQFEKVVHRRFRTMV